MDFDKLVEYQNMLQKRLKKEEQQDKKIAVLSLINQLTTGPKNIVQKEQVILEAVSRGFTEDEVSRILEQLVKDNIIYESSPGFFKKK